MSDELIVRHCSPTLAGLKAANLFTCRCTDPAALNADLRRLNRLLGPRGLRVLALRVHQGRALIYLYRPAALAGQLQDAEARRLLEERGYCPRRAGQCVARLARRLAAGGEFPHEIGLFLSYPPGDVEAFIRNGACGHSCSGCWKVYGDEAAALRTFERYRRCTDIYCRRWAAGCPLEQLAVAV